MSALYGYIPNLVQQQTTAKPIAQAPVAVQPAQNAPETAAAQANKVAPTLRANEGARPNADSEANAEKQANLNKLVANAASATKTSQPKLTAESELAANRTDPLTPADLASKRAEELEKARKHAELYRAYKEKIEAETAQNQPVASSDENARPRMDVQIPLPDEIPDRPIPRLGVPTV